tara:strand:- start:450 stop:1268 length:819 start_codon:yes stop_codon:yes gene_type:complete
MRSKFKIFETAFYESILVSIALTTRGRVLSKKNGYLYFNWGIIWDVFSPMLLVIGFALLVSIGLRGAGLELDVMIFLFLFWFGFTSIVTKIINLSIREFQIANKYVTPWMIIYGVFIINVASLFIRFMLCILALKFLNFEVEILHLTSVFILISLFSFFYSLLISVIFHNNSFISDFHNYFLQALFFTSSIIIPVTRLPENIRNILVYNPLVHLFEWLKVAYTGISYNYIDIYYFLSFMFALALIFPLSIYLKNNLMLNNNAFKNNGHSQNE